jgi:hypothetical protein
MVDAEHFAKYLAKQLCVDKNDWTSIVSGYYDRSEYVEIDQDALKESILCFVNMYVKEFDNENCRY